ncbi:MAG: hypothetical protein JWR20_2183 [Marmoricola sp.]|nr:hypothetical protein [Marmoricola sp.]
MYDDEPGALGFVPVDGRGSLPYALVHGESLVAAASWALTTAGVELLDWGVGAEAVRESGRVLVVHDPLCPLTPVEFLEAAVAECERTGAVVVGVRPVTDTVKEHAAAPEGPDVLGATVDRDALMCVVSPLVVPSGVVAALEELGVADLAQTVAALVRRVPVRYLPAPALARRVTGPEDLAVLEALSSALRGDQPG